MPQMIVIPDNKEDKLGSSMDRAFQVVQLRLMQSVLSSLKQSREDSKKNKTDKQVDKDLHKLLGQLITQSKKGADVTRSLKKNFSSLEDAVSRSNNKSVTVKQVGNGTNGKSTAGLSRKLSSLQDAISKLASKKNGGITDAQMDKLVKAVSQAKPRSRTRTFASNF